MKQHLPFFKKMFVAGILIGLCFVAGIYIPSLFGVNIFDKIEDANAPQISEGEPANILLMGIDARPGQEFNTRTDSMILACVDPARSHVALISIPRDSRVELKNGYYDRINAANVIGGPRASVQAVEKLVGVDVDYYVMVNFQNFASIIDTLGGVTIDVEKRMYKPSEGINLKPGVQRLNGHDALAYVRFRGDALGDISRTQRQQKFLKALAEEMVKGKTILKLPALVPDLAGNVTTNMSTRNMVAVAEMARSYKPADLVCQTLPGYFWTEPGTGKSYWKVDEEKAARLVAALFKGRTQNVVEDSPYAEIKTGQQDLGIASRKPVSGTTDDSMTATPDFQETTETLEPTDTGGETVLPDTQVPPTASDPTGPAVNEENPAGTPENPSAPPVSPPDTSQPIVAPTEYPQ